MNADGTGVRRLTRGPGIDYIPVWSPNGRKIAFLGGSFGAREVWVMNADGSGKRKLTRREAGPDIPVSWSPDSRTIAYSSWRDGNWEIYEVNADGSHLRNVTQKPGDDIEPVWSVRITEGG